MSIRLPSGDEGALTLAPRQSRGAGLIREPSDCVKHLADPGGVIAEEPSRLIDRKGLPDDLAAHPARPSRRSTSSCDT